MAMRLVLGGLAAALLWVNSPLASAAGGGAPAGSAVARSGCAFQAVAAEAATGGQQTFAGTARGQAVFADRANHALRCYVAVDGVEQATTPTVHADVPVATAGQVTYNAPEGASVDLCTEVDGEVVSCRAAVEARVVPQEVGDLFAGSATGPAPCTQRRPAYRSAPSDCPPYIVLDAVSKAAAVRVQYT
jgi:hypothetical protein